jgi:hypothetical protein
MYKIIFTLLLFVLIVLFTGCGGGGGGGGSSSESVTNTEVVTMIQNTKYTLSDNSIIKKGTNDAEVSIVTNIETSKTEATLISGNATCTECTVSN